MTTEQRFRRLVSLYREAEFTPNSRDCTLTIADDDQLELLLSLLGAPREYGVELRHPFSEEKLGVGIRVSLRAGDPRIGLGLLADSFDDVLCFTGGRIKAPRFFLIGSRWATGDQHPPEVVDRYHKILALISLLAESAAYLDKESQELIFVDDGKLTLPLIYSAEELKHVELSVISELLDRFGQDTHRKQKLAILSKTVRSICSGVSAKTRFAHVLEHIKEVLKQFDEGYKLFVADFSYEKIVDQMETAKLEELAKIHKVFADVQNQILGIPVATVIVATQLKPTSTVDAVFWGNSAVLLGVWVFAVLIWLVMRNQLHTLSAIKEEIERKRKHIEREYAAVNDIVGKAFPSLNKRVCAQRVTLYAVDAVVAAGVVMAHVMYFVLTEPARIFVSEYLKQFCF